MGLPDLLSFKKKFLVWQRLMQSSRSGGPEPVTTVDIKDPAQVPVSLLRPCGSFTINSKVSSRGQHSLSSATGWTRIQ